MHRLTISLLSSTLTCAAETDTFMLLKVSDDAGHHADVAVDYSLESLGLSVRTSDESACALAGVFNGLHLIALVLSTIYAAFKPEMELYDEVFANGPLALYLPGA